jgi:hypothetical protein
MVVREAVGLAQPAPQDHVHDNELSVVPLIQLQRSAGFRPVVSSAGCGAMGTVCAVSPRRRRLVEPRG